MSEIECYWGPRQFLLKGSCTDLLRLTPSELQHLGSNSKGTRDIQGEAELSDIWARARGTGFSQTEVLAEVIVPLLSPPPTESADRFHIGVTINLAYTPQPTLVSP